MIVYSEEKDGKLSVFKATTIDDASGEVCSVRKVVMPLNTVVMDGFTYICLYDDNMLPVAEAYQFLNYEMRESPLTSRSFAASALRLLYCFLSLSCCRTDIIDEKTYRSLIFFLRGINPNPQKYAMLTQRSNNTVNGYLSVYRKYFSWAKIQCEALYKSHTVQQNHALEANDVPERIVYNNNLKVSDRSAVVPKYISPDEFRRIYKVMKEAGDRQSMIIAHLLYGYGFRLGEALGMALEDIQEARKNYGLVPLILLRNRISDEKFQYAKGLPHVIDSRQYASKDYRAGTQEIIITYEFYEELLDFIEESHKEMMEKYPENYAKGAADIVSVRDRPDTNHYVFLNRYGKILSQQTWNNQLRMYFEKAGIPLDTDVRENNLSHRFRHGFAMFHARFSPHPVDALALQKLLRHKSLNSTMVYFNPTPDDEFEIKTEFQTELYDMIPELKEGLNIENTDADEKDKPDDSAGSAEIL